MNPIGKTSYFTDVEFESKINGFTPDSKINPEKFPYTTSLFQNAIIK